MKLKHRVLIAGFVLALLLPAGTLTGLADLAVQEAKLPAAARPEQVNVTPGGHVLAGIDKTSEIRDVDPASGDFTAYGGTPAIVNPLDPRMDADGNIWFADWTRHEAGRVSPDAGTVTTWPLSSSIHPVGTALDESGGVWITDDSISRLFHLTPGNGLSATLCTYRLPDAVTGSPLVGSTYVVRAGGKLWLAGFYNSRAVRVDPATGQLEWWDLPGALTVEGLAVDSTGDLWWADPDAGVIGRLSPSTNQATIYRAAAGRKPEMLVPTADGIWFTDQGLPSVGLMRRWAAGQTSQAAHGTGNAAIDGCPTVTGSQAMITKTTGTLSWANNTWTAASSPAGWTIYQTAASSQPYGLAVLRDQIWVGVKSETAPTLARFPWVSPVVPRTWIPAVTR